MNSAAHVALETLSGNTIVTGKRWWHLNETTVTLTPKQVEHLKAEAIRKGYIHNVQRVELGSIDFFSACRCARSARQVRLIGYEDSSVGFAPIVQKIMTGCARCGQVS